MKRSFWFWFAIGVIAASLGLGCGGEAARQARDGLGDDSSGAGAGGDEGALVIPHVFVDALGGLNTNPGTQQAPFRTLSRALSSAMRGQTVYLSSGTYDVGHGEVFPLQVPDGVRVEAVTAGDALVLGDGALRGLRFSGSGAVRGVRIRGFRYALLAHTGEQVIEVAELGDAGCAAMLSGDARMVLDDCEIADSRSAFDVSDSAELVVSGGEIRDLGPDCEHDTGLGVASGMATVRFDGVDAHDVAGPLTLRDTSRAVIEQSVLERVGDSDCGFASAFVVHGAAALHVERTTTTHPLGGGVHVGGDFAVVDIEASLIDVATRGIYVTGQALVTVMGTTLSTAQGEPLSAGVEVRNSGADVALENTRIDGAFYKGIFVASGSVKVRDTRIGHAAFGVYVGGGSVDLGTLTDPGGNTVQTIAETALHVAPATSAGVVVQAVGNTWLPSVQGADESGYYAPGDLSGPAGYAIPAPRNFMVEAGSKLSR